MVEHCRARKIKWEYSVRTHCERDALPTELYPRMTGLEDYARNPQSMQNTKISGKADFRGDRIGIAWPISTAPGKIGRGCDVVAICGANRSRVKLHYIVARRIVPQMQFGSAFLFI